MSLPPKVRPAQQSDYNDWLVLWQAYIDFYEDNVPEHVTKATWSRILDENSSIYSDVVEVEGRIVGLATSVIHAATWSEKPICYLEDLYVDQGVRGKGCGRALIDNLIARAKEKDWYRVYWHTKRDNVTARKLYDRYVLADGHVKYEVIIDK